MLTRMNLLVKKHRIQYHMSRGDPYEPTVTTE